MLATRSKETKVPQPTSIGHDADHFWQDGPGPAFAAVGSRAEGLTAAEAAERLARFGPNEVAAERRRSIPAKILRRLAEPMVAILLTAAAVSGATGEWPSFVIILAIVAASITLDVVQEHRAEKTAEALRRSVAIHADVLRDGAVVRVPVDRLVPGDVVRLEAGDLVPADGIVLAAHGARADEALLTGEPLPVDKRPGPSGATDAADATDALFGGTGLVSGSATMLVLRTGAATRFGGIAAALEAAEVPTAFEVGLHRLGVLIVRLTVFLVLGVLLAHLVSHRPVVESFLFAVALAVGLTPELLPMIVTVSLSRGALRMAERKVVVKRLGSIHDLGSMDVLATDKTGTLTEARIALTGHPGADGSESGRVLMLAAANAALGTGIRSPLDEAILAGSGGAAAAGWARIADIPFDFERRRVTVLAERDGERIVIVKGAPEEVRARATRIENADGTLAPLDAAAAARLEVFEAARAGEGMRLLAVGWRPAAGQETLDEAGEAELVFAGWCVFVDPPKASAAAAVLRLKAAGVHVKVISGDAAPVVQHLVATLGLPHRGLLTGHEIEAMTDSALAHRVGSVDLFARVSPDQKLRIIRALKARGHRVGFIGDGINDAPALKAADVGISVDGATDVARAAADMILLAPDLGVLADGIEEGRRTYANIMKYVRMGTSSNFGNMLSMAIASLAIPFLPLTPVQVLINNLLYDLSEVGIPFDRADPQETARPHGWDMADILRFTLVMGPLSSVFDLLTFALLALVFSAEPAVFRTAWFAESMTTQILVIFVIRTAAPAWTSRPHRVLVATSLGALAVALLLALTPLGAPFGFVPLPPTLLATLAVLVVAYLTLAEFVKRWAMAPPRRGRHVRVAAGTAGR
ncbi:magnesium-translocating P-type ATPase [Prosthecomicrobium hirschii]|uniref:magnesium-translocating P-type ATPase n=1 Tax=Prosthecodimorpha hirschii TaxID=665126 RepID=UPI0009FA15DB|nr:magnesium-translocating P-type ATPase [Prosthecomicrobium hirschii]